MERRSFLKGLLGFGAATVVPIGVSNLVSKEVISSKINTNNVDENYQYQLYIQFVKKINKTIEKLHTPFWEMWRCVTTGEFITKEEGLFIRYNLDYYRLKIEELSYLLEQNKFTDWRIRNQIQNEKYKLIKEIGFLYVVSLIAEGDFRGADMEFQKSFVENKEWGEFGSTPVPLYLGNVFMRYSNKELALKYYNIATKRGHHIKRYIAEIETKNKVRNRPMSEILWYWKDLVKLSENL